jgi:hypothetical protein
MDIAAPVGLALIASALVACGSSSGEALSAPSSVSGSVSTRLVALTVTLAGAPQLRYLLDVGWRVCDKGTVSNTSIVLARDVRVVVTYVDRGTVVATTTRDDALRNGGALGDIAAGGQHDFTVCTTVRIEPDSDRVDAAPAG